MEPINSAYEIHVKGLVQGVGFRPFIYRLAHEHQLTGWVENRNNGVIIRLETSYKDVEEFAKLIRMHAPQASEIKKIEIISAESNHLSDFQIYSSTDHSEEVTEISPDIAVCYDCLEDMKMQPRRINYPFTNCTHCGPRFTIINDLPYDRHNTTMKVFSMCGDCATEYKDIQDRRFHAQPISCNFCGPQYEFYQQGRILKDIYKITQEIKKQLYKGRIIAVKGMGGFHLMCDATNRRTVERLRDLKNRDRKPFAVMFSNFEKLKEYAHVNEVEKEHLLSWQRPIVLLKQKSPLNEAVNSGLNTLGVMLPYMPFHFLLFEEVDLPAIVLTSANPSSEPIVKDNKKAFEKLSSITDSFLIYDREIQNRCDDSVVQIIGDQRQQIRRSRGFVPTPVELGFDASGILATGVELKNTFALGKGHQAVLSQYIGDLKNFETFNFYSDTVSQFLKLFRVTPQILVSDMHPDYMTTKYARNYLARQHSLSLSKQGTRPQWLQVQHHHAHIASVMAEHQLDEKVIGVAMDGTGYGDDNQIWGGEFFVCDLEDYQRIAHFKYMPMPGGEKAVLSPWRMALSYLYDSFGNDFNYTELPFLKSKVSEDIKLILSMIRKSINSPMCSSAGRLFDAVSAMTGLCSDNCYDAEAPMKLESLIDDSVDESYPFHLENDVVSFKAAIREIVEDLKAGKERSLISAKFHNTVSQVILKVCDGIRATTGLKKVLLSGGTFQNKYLTRHTMELLKTDGFEVYTNNLVPPNDGGVSLGQLAIAAKKLK